VHRGMVEYDDAQRLWDPLGELVEEGQQACGRAPLGSVPVAALGPAMEGADPRGALTLGRSGDFGVYALATPPALAGGCVGTVRRIDPQDCDGSRRLTGVDGGDHVCPPGFFFSERGAWRGPGVAKRF
jgi:hypothetical protein